MKPSRRRITQFCTQYDAGERKPWLLYGVTGSGKTLCYIEMIQHVTAQGKQAIVLIPEIALTFQTVQRFYRRFGSQVSVYIRECPRESGMTSFYVPCAEKSAL